jgi:hypothetical protein
MQSEPEQRAGARQEVPQQRWPRLPQATQRLPEQVAPAEQVLVGRQHRWLGRPQGWQIEPEQ